MLQSSMEDQVSQTSQKFFGKVLGGLLGFSLTNSLWGALFGVAIGHAYDVQKTIDRSVWSDLWKNNTTDFSAREEEAAFTMGVIVLSAKMAKSDGRISRAEIDAFKHVFNITPAQENAVALLFDRARSSAKGFEPYAYRLAQVFSNNPYVLEEVLSGLFIIGAADSSTLTSAKVVFLKKVSVLFNFSGDDFVRIAARSGVRLPDTEQPRDKTPEPFAILGVKETASAAEIKTAYRALIREHHPDKLMAQGVPPEFIATATEKMKRINAAYDAVCRIKGIK